MYFSSEDYFFFGAWPWGIKWGIEVDDARVHLNFEVKQKSLASDEIITA